MERTGLLIASYYFYAYWDYRFCVLLMVSTGVDYIVAQRIASTHGRFPRRCWLGVSLVSNLGMLAYFKYAALLIETLVPSTWSVVNEHASEIILPVGISFFTFQTLSYTIDVYRGVLRPSRSPLTFALYIALFPQLVAGPIVRAAEFLPQLGSIPVWNRRRFYGGCADILRGLVKKVLLADRLGEMVDVVFEGPHLYDSGTIWLAVIAYTGQIYYDFSGYTDIAIGVAKTLGYRFPRNFRHPYIATNIAEFWHRWHMTLSRWLRDYLYIPLGGNRGAPFDVYRNLLVTMTLGGLWHGASWTFALWGVYHGMLLVGHRRLTSRSSRMFDRLSGALAWLATFLLVMVGWVLFRSPDLATAATVYHGMFTWRDGIGWYPPLAIVAIAFAVAEHVVYRTRLRRYQRLPADTIVTPILVTLALWTLATCAPRTFSPFVYFQF